MVQYWWVNQTRQYEEERKQGLVAGEIREHPGKTHWGRQNVSNMGEGDFVEDFEKPINRNIYILL
jgi:hypothetical protein